MPESKRERTKEATLKEIETYEMTDIRRKLIVDFVNKICLSVQAPIPMMGNSGGDFGKMEDNIPGVYWDDGTHYIDVDVNDDDLDLSLFGKNRNGNDGNEHWIESFKADKVDEPFPQEWLETYFKPFLLQK